MDVVVMFVDDGVNGVFGFVDKVWCYKICFVSWCNLFFVICV